MTSPPVRAQTTVARDPRAAALAARRPALKLARQAPDLLDTLRAEHATCPLTADQLRAALEARGGGCTWTAVAYVMGHYHGIYYCPERWRDWLRAVGVPTRAGTRPRNQAA